MKQLLTDQKVTNVGDKINAFNRILANSAKNIYNNGVQQFFLLKELRAAEKRHTDTTATADLNQSHNMGMNTLGQITFPAEAYTIQRNWLQLHVRKPLEMTVRSFQFCIEKINTMLLQFLGNRSQKAVSLNKIELKELFWDSIPRK